MNPGLTLLTALLLAPLASLHAADPQVDAGRCDDRNPGTRMQPFKTISKAAALAQAGDTACIATGVYREAVRLTQSGKTEKPIRFEAALAANVVVTGADRLTDWKKEPADQGENVYSTPWPHQFITWPKTGTHPDDDYHRLIGRAEQVFISSYPLRQVLSRDTLARGTFFPYLEGQCLYVQADNNARLNQSSPERVEVSVRGTVWDVKGDHVHTCGITFRCGATQAQQGLVRLGGRGDVVEDCVFEGSNSEGADSRGPDQVARRCAFQDNGQDGFTAGGAHRLLMTECVTRNDNTKNFNRDAQVWGWFAADDERHWPVALHRPSAASPQHPQNDTAAEYQAQRKDGAPADLNLEKLNLVFEGNLYAVQPGQGLFGWGAKWARHKECATLDAVRAELNLESGRVVESLPFANVHARDFRLPPDSLALKAGCYPRDDVPGAQLGAIEP